MDAPSSQRLGRRASHVAELTATLSDDLIDYCIRNAKPASPSPLGRVVIGGAGAGKTHLMGELRRRMWQREGWFVLLDLADVNDFWATAALSYLQSLQRSFGNGITQGDAVLLRLCATLPSIQTLLKTKFNAIFTGEGKEIDRLADAILDALRRDYRTEAQRHRHVIKVFVVFQSRDPLVSDAAYSWLQGVDVEGTAFGPAASPRDVVRGLSWLISLTGPTLLVVDQIDAIVSVHNHALAATDDGDEAERRQALKIIDELARGLMELRDITLRTVTLLSTLEATWQVLQSRAIAPAKDRFRDPDYIRPLANGSAAQSIVAGRLQAAYQAQKFKAKYPSWPFLQSALDGAVGWLPRELLRRCDAHRRKCVADGRVTELESFDAKAAADKQASPRPAIEERFLQLSKEASLADFVDPEKGEKLFPDLLLDALRCYVLQTVTPDDVDLVVEADSNKRRPALHARLRRVYRAEGDREEHHCFRAIPHANAVAFQSRLKAAITASGIDMALPFRHLFVIRRDPPPSGAKTQQLVEAFKKAGGKFASLGNDLRTMVALQTMLKEQPEGFESWLKQRKPLCDIALFREAGLCGGPTKHAESSPRPATPSAEAAVIAAEPHRQEGKRPAPAMESAPAPRASIFIGRRLIGGHPEQPRYLALDLLTRHTAVLAGSGSGKTVLLRRMIEEAALEGVPSIVLDTNNDLARLGDHWPETPTAWDDSDREKAGRYAEKVEVVVWTPGIAGGKPIMLAPMPAFAPVRGDEDELNQTVAMAHAARSSR